MAYVEVPRDKPYLQGTLYVLAAAAAWGTWSLFLRPTQLPGQVTAPYIMLFTALFTLPLIRGPRPKFDRTTWLLLLGNAAADALNTVTFFASMQVTTVAICVLSHYAAPVIIALAAPYIDKHRIRGAVPAAMAALGGLALVLAPWQGSHNWVVGGGLGLISACGYAANTFIVARLARRIGATRAISYHCMLAALLLLPVGGAALWHVSQHQLLLMALAALCLMVLPGIAFLSGLVKIGATRAGILAFAEPLVAVIIGIVVWHEPFGAHTLAGAAIVLAAGIFVSINAR